MRFSRRGIRARGGAGAGFTLLEVLLVMVITGFMVTMVVMSIQTGEDQELQREAEKLAALLQLASEEAILDGKELALAVEETGYRFEQLVDFQWQPLADDSVFRPRQLPEMFELVVNIEGQTLELTTPAAASSEGDDEEPTDTTAGEDTQTDDDSEEKPVPRVLILSSGEMSPFELLVGMEQTSEQYRIYAAALGKIKLERVQ